MTMSDSADSRLRAYAQSIVAVLYFFVAGTVAHHFALALASRAWYALTLEAILVFLLLVGYAAMGHWFNGQTQPVREQGLPPRQGWLGEVGLGLAVGWAVALVCVILMALDGGISMMLSLRLSSWGWLTVDVAFFALLALVEEVAFRGYGFQRCVEAVGPLGASLSFAVYYALVQSLVPGATHASFAVSVALGLVLSAAYLRTRALWVSWGMNFGWKASRALIFGLAVSGMSNHSPVVKGNPLGPLWLTGGGFGLDGSWMAFVALLAALPVVFRITRDLDFRYNAPEIVPGGIPVDLDAVARAQHEAAMGPPAAPPLVQISPANTPGTEPEPAPPDQPADRQ